MANKQTKQIIIDGVEFVKSGITGNRKWNMYRITDENGEKYTAFDSKYTTMLGNQVTIDYEETEGAERKDGTHFINRTIVEKPASKAMVESLQAKAGMVIKTTKDIPYDGIQLPANEAKVLEMLGWLEDYVKKMDKKLDAIIENMNPPIPF